MTVESPVAPSTADAAADAISNDRVNDNCSPDGSCIGLPLDHAASGGGYLASNDTSSNQRCQEIDSSPTKIEDNERMVQPPEVLTESSSSSESAVINPQQIYTNSLEERVRELEEKLATLSMIIQRQHRQLAGSPYRMSPPGSPLPHDEQSSTDNSIMMSASTTPSGLLDSPPPQRFSSKGKHVRNLSFRVLHEEDFAKRRGPERSPPLASSDDEGGEGLTPDTPGGVFEELPTPENANLFLPESLPGRSQISNNPEVPTLHLPRPKSKTSFDGSDKVSPDINATIPQKFTEHTNSNGSGSKRDSLSMTKSSPSASSSAGISPEKTKSSSGSDFTKKRSNSVMSATSPFTSLHGLSSPSNSSSMKLKWLDYLNSVQESNYDTDKQMEEFVKVPSAVEALLSFGFWICVDSFLYSLTILPIRFIWSTMLLLRFSFIRAFKSSQGSDGPFRFHRRHAYQIIQMGTIYLIYKCVLKPIDMSVMYHWIRVQSMVKLYLLIAIVEVFDRLMCSLGQDCLDSLYWNTTRRPWSFRMYVSISVVLAYAAVHSVLLFVHVATMNVAMNSDDQALLSLLIGGNFAEIKSTVFKKYNKASLFKITATDICERFKLALFLVLVLTLNLSQGMDKKMIYKYMHMCGIVWCAEWLSDWVKHAFITKSNYIASGVYSEYALLLAGDNSGFGHEGENLDHSHAVVKRLGLAQIPLVCVMMKYVMDAYRYCTYEWKPPTWIVVLGLCTIWSFFLVSKMFLGSFLLRLSRMKLEAAPEFSKSSTTVAKKRN